MRTMSQFSLIRQCLIITTLQLLVSQSTAVVSGRAEPSRQKSLPKEVDLCPQKCDCSLTLARGQTFTVDCGNRELNIVPDNIPKTTLNLILNTNSLISLNHSDLEGLETLETLSVANNNLYKLNANTFQDLSTLKDLDLSGNKLNSNTPVQIFRTLVFLENLNLTRNDFTHISVNRFSGLKDLRKLDLSANNIAGIDREAFVDLWSLEVLDVSSNRLTTIEHEWFQNLQNLKVLRITNNRIKRISNTVFFSLSGLVLLDISANNITTIGYLSFKGLSQVTTLDLSSNNFTLLQEGTFKPMEKLRNVDLSNNPLMVFDGLFSSSSQLQELYMYNMYQLAWLSSDSLRGLTGLKHLNLVDSNLNSIDANAFKDLRSIRVLNLQNNKLKSLFRGTFDPLGHGEWIILKGNPWECNCHLYWLLIWLGDHQSHMSSPIDTTCQSPSHVIGTPILDALDHHMVCLNANVTTKHNPESTFKLGSSATLTCKIQGFPEPTLTWITPKNLLFHWNKSLLNQTEPPDLESFINGTNNHPLAHKFDHQPLDADQLKRFSLLRNGSLQIHNIKRSDAGLYYCAVSNALSNATAIVQLQINANYRFHIQIMSILVGLATSFAFLLFTLIGVMIDMIMDYCGWSCPCCSMSPRAKQIKKLMESMESYKGQQLLWLRDNYTSQVQRIKDNCMQQMEKLRESYSSQVEKLRDIRDYGTLQIDRIRDNYYMKVQIVRDYSTSQIDRLRENYVFQRNRVRKYSAHQFIKLRENYKLQQQHLNKILETLNLESCKTTCARTDSIIFEPEMLGVDSVFNIPPLDILSGVDLGSKPCAIPTKSNGGIQSLPCSSSSAVPLLRDRLDTESQISAYYTPEDSSSEISAINFDKSDQYGVVWNDLEDKNLIMQPLTALHQKPAKRDIGVSTSDLYLTPVIIVHKSSIDQSSGDDSSSSTDHQEPIDIQCVTLTDSRFKLDEGDEASETIV